MISSAILVLLFLQAPPASRLPGFESQWTDLHRTMELSAQPNTAVAERVQALYGQQRFESSFNQLLERLLDFAAKYNAEHTVDVKKLQAVKKAWKNLEKSDPSFKLDKSN
jgi:hypothetical protein